MSSNIPPEPNFFNGGLNFNPEFFSDPTDTLTQAEADIMYLKYPLSQTGTEIINADTTFLAPVKCSNTFSFKMTDDNTSGSYLLPFSKSSAGTEGQLFVDSSTTPLNYNPNTSTITCSNFSGTASTASTITTTSDNSATTCYIPFTTSGAGNNKSLFVDDVTGPLTYQPSLSTISCASFNGSTFNNSTTNTSVNFGTTTSSGNVNIGGSTTTGQFNICNSSQLNGATINFCNANFSGANGATINMMNGNFTSTSGVFFRLFSGLFTGSASLNIMTGNQTGTGIINIGNSTHLNTLVNIGSETFFGRPISTSELFAPTSQRHLGYSISKTTGWSNITNVSSNINSFTIDGATIAFGVYKVDLFINYILGASNSLIRVCINTTPSTLIGPVMTHFTPVNEQDGTFVSQTINAYTNTTFYIVGISSSATAIVTSTGVNQSYLILTRIA